MTVFQDKLIAEFKAKGLADTTIKGYINSLTNMNCKKSLTTLDFLYDTKQVDECLSRFKESSQKTMLTAVCSVLKMKGMNDLHKYYFELLVKKANETKNIPNEKTDKQKENWMEWKDVIKIKNKLHRDDHSHGNRIKHLAISLFTDIPPRRTLDYTLMDVVKRYNDKLDKERNYLVLDDNLLIFNRYKTSRKYGQQTIRITPALRNSIDEYLHEHPLRKEKLSQYPLLTNKEGQPFKGSNSLTMLLNAAFGKKVSASMLRHIYLSNEFGDELKHRQEIAKEMGHSVSQQADYIKFDE
jgi:integrase